VDSNTDDRIELAIDFEKKFYFEPTDLFNQFHNQTKCPVFLTSFAEKLIGSAAAVRGFMFWRALVALILMPEIKPNEIWNASSHMLSGTLQFNPWTNVRNILVERCDILKCASSWLACYLEWKLISDGEFIYRKTVEAMKMPSEDINNKSNNSPRIDNLFFQVIQNYDTFVKHLTHDFEENARIFPKDLASIIDEEATNLHEDLGSLLRHLKSKIPEEKTEEKTSNTSPQMFDVDQLGPVDGTYFSFVLQQSPVTQPQRTPDSIQQVCSMQWAYMKFNATKLIQDRCHFRIWTHILQENSTQLDGALKKKRDG